MEALGPQFARALAARERNRLADLMHAEIDFRGLTPNRAWEAAGPDQVLDALLGHWFEDSDVVEALEHVESGTFADRERVGYRLRVRNPKGDWLVEQQAFLAPRDGRIGWMRVLCSGYRPAR